MKPRYKETESFEYSNWKIEAGRVFNSPHPENVVYLRFKDTEPDEDDKQVDELWDLTEDEALAIVYCLSAALFEAEFRRRFKGARITES